MKFVALLALIVLAVAAKVEWFTSLDARDDRAVHAVACFVGSIAAAWLLSSPGNWKLPLLFACATVFAFMFAVEASQQRYDPIDVLWNALGCTAALVIGLAWAPRSRRRT